MTVPYSMRQQGWMLVDNGGPGSITKDQARAQGLPSTYATQSVVELDTLHCRCCGGVVIKNPERTRERNHCTKCNWFQCDGCAYLATLPDYVHQPFLQKVELAKTAAANLTCI